MRNNPIRYTDPHGHCLEDACVIEVGAGSAALLYGGAALAGAVGLTGLAATRHDGADTITSGIKSLGNAISSIFTESGVQGRDAQGKFLPKQPGQSQPGAGAERDALAAEGATKTGTKLPGTDRRVDGTVTSTGQKIEVKSGGTVNNTDQLVQTGRASKEATGQPLLVVTTKPNAKVSKPAQHNPDLQIRPVKKPQP